MLGEPELLDREDELAAIESLIDAAMASGGGGLLLGGAAGLGKTTLLDTAMEAALERGMRVLRARGDELEQGLPWGGALQLYGDLVRESAAPVLFSGAAGLAGSLLERGESAREETPSGDPLPLLHGLYWLVANLCDRSPLLIVTDDAHWLDPETLRHINHLLARIDELPIAMIAAERLGDPLEPAAERLLSRLRARPQVATRRLVPLGDGAARRLARRDLPEASGETCAAIASAGGGNPFFIRELTSTARSEGFASGAAPIARLRELRPDQIRNSILVRLGLLGEAAGRLAAATAVLGPSATPGHAAKLAGIASEEATKAIDALTAAMIVEGGDSLDFVHPIVRDLVYADASPARRRRDHLLAARVLHESGAPAREISSQLRSSEPAGERWALAALREAARAALARGSPATAAALSRRALDERPAPELRRDLLAELGAAEAAAGLPDGPAHLREALELAGEGAASVPTAVALGEALLVTGRFDRAMEAFERGLDLFERRRRVDGQAVEAELLAGIGAAGTLALQPSERLRVRAGQYLESQPESPTLLDRVLIAIAAGAATLDVDVSDRRLASLATMALGDDRLSPAVGRVLVDHLTMALAASGRLELAIDTVGAAVAAARQRGEMGAYVSLLPLRAWYALQAGRLSPALADAAEAIALAGGGPGDHASLAVAHHVLALGSLDRGDLGAARDAVDVPDATARWGSTLYLPCLLYAAGRVQLASGASREALATLRRAGSGHLARNVHNPAFSPWRSGAALAAHRVGERAEARSLAGEELELARRFGAPGPIGIALRGQALIAGQGAHAVELMEESVRSLEESELAIEHARSLVELGAVLRRAGWDRDCRRPLREGLERARERGALGLAARAHEELVASGARPRRLAVGGAEALTPSERRVAEMAAGGMSNREIAEALFVTRRTIETHLTHAYAKLEISSRDELERALEPGS